MIVAKYIKIKSLHDCR